MLSVVLNACKNIFWILLVSGISIILSIGFPIISILWSVPNFILAICVLNIISCRTINKIILIIIIIPLSILLWIWLSVIIGLVSLPIYVIIMRGHQYNISSKAIKILRDFYHCNENMCQIFNLSLMGFNCIEINTMNITLVKYFMIMLISIIGLIVNFTLFSLIGLIMYMFIVYKIYLVILSNISINHQTISKRIIKLIIYIGRIMVYSIVILIVPIVSVLVVIYLPVYGICGIFRAARYACYHDGVDLSYQNYRESRVTLFYLYNKEFIMSSIYRIIEFVTGHHYEYTVIHITDSYGPYGAIVIEDDIFSDEFQKHCLLDIVVAFYKSIKQNLRTCNYSINQSTNLTIYGIISESLTNDSPYFQINNILLTSSDQCDCIVFELVWNKLVSLRKELISIGLTNEEIYFVREYLSNDLIMLCMSSDKLEKLNLLIHKIKTISKPLSKLATIFL